MNRVTSLKQASNIEINLPNIMGIIISLIVPHSQSIYDKALKYLRVNHFILTVIKPIQKIVPTSFSSIVYFCLHNLDLYLFFSLFQMLNQPN